MYALYEIIDNGKGPFGFKHVASGSHGAMGRLMGRGVKGSKLAIYRGNIFIAGRFA